MSGYISQLRALVGARPLIAVSADVLIFKSSGEVLLQRRSDSGDWSLPGGGMELGESFEDTARRELREEVGLEAGSLELVTVCSGPDCFHRYPNGDEVYAVVTVVIAHGCTGIPRPDGRESLETGYFVPDSPPAMPESSRHILARAMSVLRAPK